MGTKNQKKGNRAKQRAKKGFANTVRKQAKVLGATAERMAGLRSLLGIESPVAIPISSNIRLREHLGREIAMVAERYAYIRPDDQFVVSTIERPEWAVEWLDPIIALDQVRKAIRLPLKKAGANFMALQQIAPSPLIDPDGPPLVSHRVSALMWGPGLHADAASSLQPLREAFTARGSECLTIEMYQAGTPIIDLGTRLWSSPTGLTALNTDPATLPANWALRMVELEAHLDLRLLALAAGRGKLLLDALMDGALARLKLECKGSPGTVHRDGIAKFVSDLNIELGLEGWRLPFARWRK